MPREPQINVRLPDDMRERMKLMAKQNRRSMNSEFILAVEAWIARAVQSTLNENGNEPSFKS